MDSYAFTLELARALGWPVSFIVAVFLLRSPLAELMPLLKKLKYKDIEVEFYKDTSDVVARLEEYLPKEASSAEDNEDKEPPTVLFSRRTMDTEEQIGAGWFALQRGIFDAMARHNLSSKKALTAYQAAKLLHEADILNDDLFKVFTDLVILKNKLEHAGKDIVSWEIAHDFLVSSNKFENYLNTLNPTSRSINQ
ncbi:MAG: hypothetical protein AB2689_22595 [Candidatus Thiodiazotropha taylori]